MAGDEEEAAAAAVDRFLSAVAPAPDPAVQAVARMAEAAAADLTITRVGELARRLGVGTRTLQRLFAAYGACRRSGSSGGTACTRRPSGRR